MESCATTDEATDRPTGLLSVSTGLHCLPILALGTLPLIRYLIEISDVA